MAVQIDDIVSGDFTAALKDVSAVIHLASPLAGREAPKAGLNSAIEGTVNILPGPQLSIGRNPLYVYCGMKTLAEQAARKLAKEHGKLDLATFNPPFVYGAPVTGLSPGGLAALGTNALIYQLIAGEPGRALPPQLPPYYCNVRDVARAHILALRLPKLAAGADVRDKRFIVAGPGAILRADVVKTFLAQRPALRDQLPTLEDAPPLPGTLSKVDTTRAREVLGVKEHVGQDETLLETVDALVELEKTWK